MTSSGPDRAPSEICPRVDSGFIMASLDLMQNDPAWRDLLLFHEYFHGAKGAGLGASHQTGWTGAVAVLFGLDLE